MRRDRELMVKINIPTKCCGAKLIIDCDGIYKCPCGKNQEKAVRKSQ
jgi:hypothetical protein